jgi:pilus assembly protein CpaB
MSRARLLVLLIALVCAVAAALLARNLMLSPAEGPAITVNQPAPEPKVEVLVAARELAMGERLSAGALTWREWPASNVGESMITRDARPDAIENLAEARARLPILIGEPIADRKTVQAKDRGLLSAVLPKGMRAIAISVSEQTAVSGFVLPNDRVDVLLTTENAKKPTERPSWPWSSTLLTSEDAGTQTRPVVTNVRVLAINQTYGQELADTTSLPGLQTAVLELDPQQATAVTAAERSGTLSLALRSIAEEGDGGLVNEKPELITESIITIIRAGVEARVAND